MFSKNVSGFGSFPALFSVLAIVGLLQSAAQAYMQDSALVERMQQGGAVLMIRHAEAPGIGDPDDFSLDDCSTQRNLSERGRQQARDIGKWLRDRGITSARVYSSQWCRCLDTASLMDIGEVTPFAGLNNFFTVPEDRESNLAKLRDFLSSQPADGELLVLVTHQVTISAITGEYTDSGHGKLLGLDGNGNYSLLGTLDFR
jgi:broad specificity phosphatase PhoE